MAVGMQGTSAIRGTFPATAATAIAANLLVEDHTVAGQVTLCGANKKPCGVAYYAIASAAVGDIAPLVPGDIVAAVGSAGIAIGDHVMAAASGQVAPETSVAVPTAYTIGKALSVCSGSGGSFYFRVTV